MELVRPECAHPLPEAHARQEARGAEAEKLYGDLKFEAQRCAYYHGMRARFFDSFGKSTSLISLVFGAGAFTSLIQGMGYLVSFLATVTAFFSGLNLIVGFARKGRDHEVLRSKYYGLLVEIEKAHGDLAKLQDINLRKIGFYGDGTIFLSALDVIAHNRTCASTNRAEYMTYVPWRHRAFAHVWSFTGDYSNGKRSITKVEGEGTTATPRSSSPPPVE